MKAQVFSVEALLALLLAASFISLQPTPQAPDYNNLYRYQLVQDFLEVSVKNPHTLGNIRGFADGDKAAQQALEAKYSSLLKSTGDFCLELTARDNVLKTGCDEEKAVWVSASRVVFDGKDFFTLTVRLGFDA